MNIREASFWAGADDPRITPEHFNQIVATAADIALVVTLEGTIDTVVINPLNRSIGHLDHWVNRDLRDFLAIDSVDRVESILSDYRDGKAEITPSVEVNHRDNSNWDFPIRYSFYLTGHDNTLLMLGRDLRPVAELQQRLVKAQLALEKDYESRRDFETRYRVVMETSRDAMLLVDPSSGRITDVNAAAAKMIGAKPDSIVGAALTSELTTNQGDVLDLLLSTAAHDTDTPVMLGAKRVDRAISVVPHLFRAGGDRAILCRLDSTDAPATTDDLGLTALFASGADAMVFTDSTGRIESANDAFANMCNLATNATSKHFADFLHRGQLDLNVLIDTARDAGRMRLYSTQIKRRHGSEVSAEISTTHLGGDRFAFVIRDTTRNDVLRETPDVNDDARMQNVVALVGSSPLKEIVAATTDVIEKLCIESAIELTGNNRVAAADMLGLSRQSLYVKLRKYDLVDRDG